MATTLRDVRPAALPEPPRAAGQVPARRPFRDNPRLILLGIVILLVALVAMVTLADRAPDFNPNFLTEVLLYALSAADLMMLLALGFVLARNIVKLVVERRRGLPFSRFRAKLVGALLGLTIIPALLVLLVGGELIRSSTRKWVQPAGRRRAHVGAPDRQRVLPRARGRGGPARRARSRAPCRRRWSGTATSEAVRRLIEGGMTAAPVRRVEVYRVSGNAAPVLVAVGGSAPGPHANRHSASEALVSRVVRGSGNTRARVARRRRRAGAGRLADCRSRIESAGRRGRRQRGADRGAGHRIAEGSSAPTRTTRRLRVMTRPLQGMYLSLFLMMTLMILVSATWMGLYLAKRITRPVQMLAQGAREIGAGHLDHRIEPETRDEFGALIEAFNSMAGELATGQRTLERSRLDLERKNLRARGAPPLHRDRPGAHRHRRGVDRRRRPHRDGQRRGAAAPRRRSRRGRHAGRRRVRARRSAAARRAAAPGARRGRARRARGRDGPRGT